VVYGLLILNAGIAHAGTISHLVALVTVLSIVAHSSTDVLVAGWFRRTAADRPPPQDVRRARRHSC
jgi:sodium/hydrogen antiporter